MSRATIGIFCDPWAGLAQVPNSIRAPLRAWRKLLYAKANPRSADYMRTLFEREWGGGSFVDTGVERSWESMLEGAARVVLLYPDANGIGFGRIERRVRRLAPRAAVHVLNGRQRQFLLDASTATAVRLRRFLECTMLIETVISLGILVATPVLLGIDVVRGRW